MNVLVDTDEGVACICGDVIYDVVHQLVDPHLQRDGRSTRRSPATTAASKRGEKAAIRKALNGVRFVLPAHDRPARARARSRGRAHVRPRARGR